MLELSGKTFNRLTAMWPAGYVPNGRNQKSVAWLFLCQCGNYHVTSASSVAGGNTKSCGCWNKEVAGARLRKHGHVFSATWRSWAAMRQRCLDSNQANWKYYGGRGITVCERWNAFENFLADMGEKPHGLTLDRIDVNGNYEPGNCRWSTRSEQCANQRPYELTPARLAHLAKMRAKKFGHSLP